MNLATEHIVLYIVLIVPVAVLGFLANTWYLFWQVFDRDLICSFNVHLGNIAVCNLFWSVALSTLEIITLFHHDKVSCTVYRLLTSFIESEEGFIFLFMTMDRLFFLIKGAREYRDVVTVKRSFVMVFLSWVVSSILTITLWCNEEDIITINAVEECKLAKPEVVTALPLAFDCLIMCLCLVIVQRYHVANADVSSTCLQSSTTRANSRSHMQLHARDSAAYSISKITPSKQFTKVERLKSDRLDQPKSIQVTPTPTELDICDKTEDPDQTEVAEGTQEKKGRMETASQTAAPSQLPNTVISSSNRCNVDKSSKGSIYASENRRVGHPTGSMVTCHYGSRSAAECSYQLVENWSTHPRIKSTLPDILIKSNVTFTGRIEILAARQIGLLLVVHFLFGSPAYICRFLAVEKPEWRKSISNFMHWLDWLSLLQVCLYPVVYCIHSDRLIYHLLTLLGQCSCQCCRRHHRVSVAAARMDSK